MFSFRAPSRLVFAACVLFLPLLPGPGTGHAQQARLAEWTLLIYCAADCDLEEAMMDDLVEMARAGSNGQVHILVLADRSPLGDDDEDEEGYTNEPVLNLRNWSGAKLLYVKKDRLVQLADFGDTNMGDPVVLQRFLEIGLRRYPARHYALFLNDHGMGWSGICSDDGSDGDSLTLDELQAVLQATVRGFRGRLDLIGCDACLMSTVETAVALAPFARVLVASEETEPASGFDYTSWIGALQRRPDMDSIALGRAIADSYRDSFAKSDDEDERNKEAGITLSVIDLSRVQQVARAVLALAERNTLLLRREERKTWIRLARSRARAEEYGGAGDPDEGEQLHDLIHLAELIKQQLPDDQTVRLCDNVIAATRAAVRYEIHGKGRPQAHGLSVYFPLDSEQFDEDSQEDYARIAFGGNSRWFAFLKAFVDFTDSDRNMPDLKPVAASQKQIRPGQDEITTLTSAVAGGDAEAIERAYFVLARPRGNKRIIIGQLPAEIDAQGRLKADWDGRWFALRASQDNRFICPVTEATRLEDKKNSFRIEVPVQVRRKDKKAWHDISLYFLVELGKHSVQGQFVHAMRETDHGPREWRLRAGDQLRPVYLQIDAKGREKPYIPTVKETVLTLSKPGDLKIGRDAVIRGEYLLGFTVEDLAGHYDEEDIAIMVR
jgi:hypothetical protein